MMGLERILVAIGRSDDQSTFVTASVDDAGQLVAQQSPALQGVLFPDPSAAWKPWQLSETFSSVSRILFFKKGASLPCLVVDTVPDVTTLGFQGLLGFFTRILLNGRLPAVIAGAGSVANRMPGVQLEISGFRRGESPFGSEGFPVFSNGYLGDGDQPIPSGTELPDLKQYSGKFTKGYPTAPAVGRCLNLDLNRAPVNLDRNMAPAAQDWRQVIRLSFIDTQTGQPPGLRLVMERYFELTNPTQVLSLGKPAQPLSPQYYTELGFMLIRTTSGNATTVQSTFPPGFVPTSFIQEQPATILTDAAKPRNTNQPAWEVVLEGVSYRAIQDVWNSIVVRPYYRSVRVAAESQPISLLPFWRDAARPDPLPPPTLGEPVYALRFAVTGWQDSNNPVNQIGLAFKALELTRATANLTPFATQLEFPGLIDHHGNPLTVLVDRNKTDDRSCVVTLAPFQPNTLPAVVMTASWLVRLDGDGTFQRIRIGALDLGVLQSGAGLFFPDDELGVTVQVALESLNIDGEFYTAVRPHVMPTTILPIFDILPGAQDAPAGAEYLPAGRNIQFARPPALVFATPDGATASASASPRPVLLLQVHEDTGGAGTGDSQSPKITMRLRQPAGALPDFGRVIILDPSPFVIATVSGKFVRQTASNLLGTWTNGGADGASWQLALAVSDFDLTLPPQAIGETMSKGPISKGETTRTNDFADDLQAGQFSDFRFSPLAKAKLKPAPFPQQFVEPYWNLRRRLGFPGQRAPGSGLSSLRFELLYGLQIDVHAPFMQLAEMQSRLGSPMGALDEFLPWANVSPAQSLELGVARNDWALACNQLDRRLGLLELWSPLQTGDFQLDSDVDFTQRAAALDQMRNPFPGPHDPARLAGGWMWGFESPNILAAVLRSANATSGELARPALSALGGWGWQKARFDEDRTSIIADTAMGRTGFYSLERIGRIATFWNTAKHVIVYERTVQQRQSNFSRPGLEGRPVLRKVAEYVEILQPIRNLPDDVTANPLAMGFFQSVEFPKQNNTNPRIPVDSAWGGDVDSFDIKGKRTTGWQVPLWCPGLDSTAYPKPHILSRITTVPGDTAPTALIEHGSPQVFRFYTSTVQGDGADPDRWLPVETVDFIDRPLPNLASNSLNTRNLDALLPSPAPVALGFENFTYALDPSPIKVNLTAGRSVTAVGAALRNVIVMRGVFKQPEGVPPPLQPVKAVSSASAFLDTLDATAGQVLASRSPDEALGSVLSKVKSTLLALPDAAEYGTALAGVATGTNLSQAILGPLAKCDPCSYLKGLATDRINRYASTLTEQITQLKTDLVNALTAIAQSPADKFKAQARIILGRIADPLAAVSGDFDDALGSAGAGLQSASRAVSLAGPALSRECDTFTAGLGAALSLPLSSTWQLVTDLLFSCIESYRSRLEVVLRSVAAAVQNLGRQRLGGLKAAPGAANVPPDLNAAIDAIRKTLPLTLAMLRARVTQAAAGGAPTAISVARIVTDLTTGLADPAIAAMQAKMTDVQTLLQNGIDALRLAQNGRAAAYDDLASALQTAINKFDGIVDSAGSASSCISGIADVLDACITAINGTSITDTQSYRFRFVQAAQDAIQTHVCGLLGGESWEDQRARLADFLNKGGEAAQRICNELDAFAAQGTLATIAAAQQTVSDLVNAMRGEVDQISGQAMQYIDLWKAANPQWFTDSPGGAFFSGGLVCALPRALAEAPEALGQAINRELVALHFDQFVPEIDMTPVGVLVDRLGDNLKSLGMRMPSMQLLDGFVPDTLGIGIGDLFPDFSGLKLDGLFSGITLDNYTTDEIKLSHGVDAQTRRAWVEAAIDAPMPPDMAVLSWEVLELRLQSARFQASSRIEAGIGSAVQRTATGNITGNWVLVISGAPLVIFKDTSLTFDGGHISFKLSPNNIELGGGLEFLTTYLTEAQGFLPDLSDDGVSMRLIQADGVPVGAEAVLDLPLPPLDFGTFGIANIELAGSLGLGMLPGGPMPDSGFAIRLMFSLAKQTSPFTLTVFVLGGGGWLEADCTYYPSTGDIVTDVTISFGATARVGFNFGVVSGSAELYFGLAAEFHSSSHGTTFSLAIVFVADGTVTVLGILSIDMNLTLEVVYSAPNATGYGTLRVRAKLGPFFSISVDQSITYKLAGDGGSQTPQQQIQGLASPHTQESAETRIRKSAYGYHNQLEQEG